MTRTTLIVVAMLCLFGSEASAENKTAGDYLAETYEVKAMFGNNLVLQRGNRAFLCIAGQGPDPAALVRDAPCKPINK